VPAEKATEKDVPLRFSIAFALFHFLCVFPMHLRDFLTEATALMWKTLMFSHTVYYSDFPLSTRPTRRPDPLVGSPTRSTRPTPASRARPHGKELISPL
jgi:hypothetical protein